MLDIKAIIAVGY